METYPCALNPELHGVNGCYNHCYCTTDYRFSLQYVNHPDAKNLLASLIDKLTQFNWIVTAFTLTSTSTILVYGQVFDVFGRHSVIQASISFILVGSVLGAAAQVWPMLLLGRAFQGLGFAGLGIVTKLILSDKVSLRENSVNNTIFALLNGLSVGVGPVIGGYLTKVYSCALIQIPRANIPGLLALVLHYQRPYCCGQPRCGFLPPSKRAHQSSTSQAGRRRGQDHCYRDADASHETLNH